MTTTATPEELHRLLDAALDRTPVYHDALPGKRGVRVEFYFPAASEDGSLYGAGVINPSAPVSFTPPFEWGITEEQAIEAARTRAQVWIEGTGPRTACGVRWKTTAIVLGYLGLYGDDYYVTLTSVSLTEPPA